MGGITQVPGFSEVSSFFQWAGSILPCTRGENALFRRTIINKLDEQGQPKVYDVRIPGTQDTHRTTQLSYIQDVSTGDLYLDEEWQVIATKCVAIAIGNPLYAIGTEVFHLTKTMLVVGVVAMDAIKKIGENIYRAEYQKIGSSAWEWVEETAAALHEGIWDLLSTPIFALGVELAALYGIFDQYQGRKWVAAVEHAWQKGASYRLDHEKPPRNENDGWWTVLVNEIKSSRTHYLANCFQIRGNIHDRQVRVIRSEAL